MRPFVIFTCLCLLTNMAFAQDAGVEVRKWNFETDQVDQPPQGFKTAVGTWTTVRDGNNLVLAETAQNADAVFNIILRPDVLYPDMELRVKVKGVKGIVDQGGGLVWRAKNAQTYYVARNNPLEDSYRVYKVLDGKRSQLGSVKVPGDNEWHDLRVTMKGNKIACFLDEKIRMEVEDSSIRG